VPWQRVVRSAALLSVVGCVLGSGSAVGARDEVLSTDDAVLERVAVPVSETLPPVHGCRRLLDAGRGDCTVVHGAEGRLVVTVQPGRRIDDILVSRPWTVRVYRPAAGVPDGWELALATRHPDGDGDGPLFAAVTAKAVDITRDGKDELIVGYRSEGTGMILDVDIVGVDPGGAPRVLAHDQLYKGSVVFRHGRLVAWAPEYERTDANCCPTWVRRAVLELRDGAFSVDADPRVRSRRVDVPASELG
jgi:hypothetical protein